VVKPIELSGDVVAGASALAGLFLVYVGNVGLAFEGYDRTAKTTVRPGFQKRAWLGVTGILLAMLSVGLALAGKWAGNNLAVAAAVALLFVALLVGLAIAVVAVRDIR